MRILKFLEDIGSPEGERLAYQSIKFLYKNVIEKPIPVNIQKMRRQKRLPIVLRKDEIINILNTISNQKHKLMISMLYGSGLRLSEVISLKVGDFDLERRLLRVIGAKGNKDRMTIISPLLINDLEPYIVERRPGELLFITNSGNKYSRRTIQLIFEKALLKSRIQKPASCHTLRHSFATHLVESGVSVKVVQQLLGHSSIKTTSRYIHLAKEMNLNVVSPLI